ncbi:hypothetical protein Scep_025857 [Stephania cephalantha]|uniref:Uncharacterized protein n=1 Tax=Stephania cephalantha TaxID=152367 RepID=A0AAP0ERA5_9MAGN
MDYRTGSLYEAQSPMYRQTTAQAHHQQGGGGVGGASSLYPRLGQQQNPNLSASRIPSFHHSSPSPSTSCNPSLSSEPYFMDHFVISQLLIILGFDFAAAGLGIRVAIKPEYRITPPPQLSPQVDDIPRSMFQFDFELERKILAEAEKESPNWGRLGLENLPLRRAESSSSSAPVSDPVIKKYIALGLNREAVPFAVANYGDNSTKTKAMLCGQGVTKRIHGLLDNGRDGDVSPKAIDKNPQKFTSLIVPSVNQYINGS